MEPRRNLQDLLDFEDYLLLAAALLLPWAFGGVDIWAYRGAALLLAGAASVSLWKEGWAGLGLDRRVGWLWPAFLLAAWAGLQLIPLPPQLLRVASPTAYQLYASAFPGYDGAPVASPLSALESEALARVPQAAAHALPTFLSR